MGWRWSNALSRGCSIRSKTRYANIIYIIYVSLILGTGLNSVADLAVFDLGCNCNNVSWQHLGIFPVKGMVFIPSLLSSEVFCRLHLGGWSVDGQFQFLHCPMQVCELHWPGSGEFGSARNTFSNQFWSKNQLGLMMFGHMSHLSCVVKACNIFQFRGSSQTMPFQFGWFPMVRNSPPGEVWRFTTSLTLPKKSSKIPRLFTGYGFHFEFMGCFYDMLP